MSETDQKTRYRSQHPLARVLPLAGGVLGAMAFAIAVIPINLPWASSSTGMPAVVTFDTAKYVNARRAAASERRQGRGHGGQCWGHGVSGPRFYGDLPIESFRF